MFWFHNSMCSSVLFLLRHPVRHSNCLHKKRLALQVFGKPTVLMETMIQVSVSVSVVNDSPIKTACCVTSACKADYLRNVSFLFFTLTAAFVTIPPQVMNQWLKTYLSIFHPRYNGRLNVTVFTHIFSAIFFSDILMPALGEYFRQNCL